MISRSTSLVLVSLLVAVTGCRSHAVGGPSAVERSAVSTTLECENNLRNTGQPDYGLPAEPITEVPVDQAARFVDGTGIRRNYPDAEIALAEQQPTMQTIALVSDGKSVGILRYEHDEDLGWHLASAEQCSPGPAERTAPERISFGGSAKESRGHQVQVFLDGGGQLCAAGDLRHKFVMGGGAGGWIVAGLNIVNTSRRPCALEGPLRFVGLDASGRVATDVTVCDDMILKHQSCATPIVLYPLGTAEPRQHPNAISVRLLGWSRGGHKDSDCPSGRVVAPKALDLRIGALSLRFANHDPHWAARESPPAHIWGCGDLGIAG